MTQEQAIKLATLFADGHKIKCTQGQYLDGFINDIYPDADEVLCYSSNTYTDVPLIKISTLQIEVYKCVKDWQ